MLKKPGETLGFYIRQVHFMNRYDIMSGIYINQIKNDVSNNVALMLLRVNDEIIKINDKSIKNMELDDVVLMLSSQTNFTLTIKRYIDRFGEKEFLNEAQFSQINHVSKKKNSLENNETSNNKLYDIINGKVDHNYSHKLYFANQDENKSKKIVNIKNIFQNYDQEEDENEDENINSSDEHTAHGDFFDDNKKKVKNLFNYYSKLSIKNSKATSNHQIFNINNKNLENELIDNSIQKENIVDASLTIKSNNLKIKHNII